MPLVTPMERHIATGLIAVIFALLSWNVYTTYSTSVQVATMAERMSSLQTSLVSLQARMADRYTSADALRDFAIRDDRITEIRKRLDVLERRQ